MKHRVGHSGGSTPRSLWLHFILVLLSISACVSLRAGHYSPWACQPRTFSPSDISPARTFPPPTFGVARNFCSGLALTLIICCYWSRGNVLGTRKAEGKRLGEHVQEGECPAPAEVFHPELQY